jgi:hypothetical protein
MEEKMKRNLFIIIIIAILPVLFYSADTTQTQPLTANSQLTEVRLSGFEDASFWDVYMPLDQGVILKQTKYGAPVDVSDDKATNSISKRDDKYGIPKTYDKHKVLGVKVQYIARGYNWFTIRPSKPIIIEGICQSISCFVAGRNYRHTLKMLILDYFGSEREVIMDKLNFIGWRELVATIPSTIIQTEYHYAYKQGIKFNGFLVECDPQETFCTYYLYFDELRAITDIFNEKTRDVDDMYDDW